MQEPAVEVFRTTVARRAAAVLLQQLRAHFPAWRITFDLQDPDRILRVQAAGGAIDAAQVAQLLHARGFCCEPLPD
ncbi:hypothetical protein [Hymenobacter weizhouensis]|uniref:hypothetical protein n=1 Tax=Hymenobacter sp. YIM 151500-1 TaxID=2987689 RepID=UPI0022266EA2|nr:hypothetical protein [Hymenobacter sp. YIM 151500-1]UYZ61753.1 hypothetical protein OIS53_12150 [Hymenobacter sp. YIM 151500-1]